MAEHVSVDSDIVGIDNELKGVESCCINSLYAEEATPNGVGIVCNVCGDVWVSTIEESSNVLWRRTYAGRYTDDVRAKIEVASKNEHRIKRNIVLSIAAVFVFVIIWNIFDYATDKYALSEILLSSFIVIIIGGAVSVAMFKGLFRSFSRNTRKLKYELPRVEKTELVAE
jgi:hypothetical protein